MCWYNKYGGIELFEGYLLLRHIWTERVQLYNVTRLDASKLSFKIISVLFYINTENREKIYDENTTCDSPQL